ncbi:hypothetical protein AB0D86_48605 [Streptomyces sp. NPDC048324]|uniref:hypothetical protein n=1 Tax=Streptomyces sp. NPDC048324 TaxID=3157205 RepID=UPI0034253376
MRAVNHLSDLPRRRLEAIRPGGDHVSEPTVLRRRDEPITLLAAQAPRPDREHARRVHRQCTDEKAPPVRRSYGDGTRTRRADAVSDTVIPLAPLISAL